MQKQAPTLGRLFVMVAFALSCFGLLLFLWLAFGGSIPLEPRGWRFEAQFSEATQLAKEADVRISGVPVGKVKDIQLARDGRSTVTIELKRRYSPLPSNARAILRQKTLLGETYVELTPGTSTARKLKEGGMLPVGNVSPTVELDEIFRAFDAKTRQSFQIWMESLAQGTRGQGQAINDAFGTLSPLAVDVTQLRPPARQLSPTLVDLSALAPDLKAFFVQLNPLISSSRTGLPALREFLRELPPVLGQVDPFLRELRPILSGLGFYKDELNAFFSNTVAATQAAEPNPNGKGLLHYLRTTNPLNPENLAVQSKRLSTNRPNPYEFPGAFLNLKSGLPVYENRQCNGSNFLQPLLPTGPGSIITPGLNQLINQFVFGAAPAGAHVAAPPRR